MELFLVKKLEIQIVITMIMLTRFWERIFNPTRCTGIKDYIKILYVLFNPNPSGPGPDCSVAQ